LRESNKLGKCNGVKKNIEKHALKIRCKWGHKAGNLISGYGGIEIQNWEGIL
jgi:hypothetical protein